MRRTAQRTTPRRGRFARGTGGAGGSRLICMDLRTDGTVGYYEWRTSDFPGNHPAQRFLVDVSSGNADADRLARERFPQGEQPGKPRRTRPLGKVVCGAKEEADRVRDGALAHLDEAGQPLAKRRKGVLVHAARRQAVGKRVRGVAGDRLSLVPGAV